MKMKLLGLAAMCLALGLAACGSPDSTSNARTIAPPTGAPTGAPTDAPTGALTPASQTVTAQSPTVAAPSATPSATAPAGPSRTPPVTPTSEPQPIGEVARKTDVVEHGAAADALAPLLGSAALFQGDILKIHDGGEGLLTFGNQLTLQLFNDSQLGVIASSPPGTPLDIQIALTDGGFTGQLTGQGGRAVFTTPGGAQITIQGTDFLIAYDPATHVTTAGNFHGSVQVASGGAQMTLASGSAVVVPAAEAPGAQFPVTFSEAQFQQQARRLQSPVLAASQNNASAGSATLAVSDDHACALTPSGGLVCWGNNDNGQLGDGTTNASPIPVEVAGLPGRVVQVAIAEAETCAVIDDGTAVCWGSNKNGTGVEQSAQPLPLRWPSGPVQAVAPGNGFTCVLTTKGAVECRGDVGLGQNSDGSLTSGVVAITTGLRDHTCALLQGGGVRCWGSGPRGELGTFLDGGNSDTPLNVGALKDPVTAVAAGGKHTCVLTALGGVQCWGDNLDSQLGNAAVDTNTNKPVRVEGLASGVVAISASHNHTCALTAAGAVKCWGSDHLGDGKTIASSTPIDVPGLARGVVAIAAGGANTCALLTNGAIRCWGDNTLGQLGDGTTTASQTPVEVFGLGPAR